MSGSRKTAADFDPEVLRLFDRYVHGDIPRRAFLREAARFAAGVAGAGALLEALAPRFASAQQVKPDDDRIDARTVGFDAPRGNDKGSGYLVRPKHAKGKPPVVLVIHENRGLNPHIEDIARRLALADFIAFAPDALFPLGGYPGDEDAARAKFAKLDAAKTREDFLAAAAFARRIEGGNGRLGAVGFCWGGGMVNFTSTRVPELAAAVPFYGAAPPLKDVPRIKAELLLFFAGNDQRINAGWPAYEAALEKAGVRYEAKVFPGVEHGFNNDTTPRYDEAAAKEAWSRTLAFLDRRLRVA